MSNRMRWMVGLAVLALCIICGLLGLTAGINLNPDSTVRFVPLWGSLGDWFAGAGAFAAVLFALRSEWKRRQEDVESLNVRQSYDSNRVWSIQLISIGKRPARILELKLRGPDLDPEAQSHFRTDWFENYTLPVTLAYAESAELKMSHNVWLHLYQMAQSLGATGSADQLKLIVVTTVREFSFPLEGKIIDQIKAVSDSGDRQVAVLIEKGVLRDPDRSS